MAQIIASVGLRAAYGLQDGDVIDIELPPSRILLLPTANIRMNPPEGDSRSWLGNRRAAPAAGYA